MVHPPQLSRMRKPVAHPSCSSPMRELLTHLSRPSPMRELVTHRSRPLLTTELAAYLPQPSPMREGASGPPVPSQTQCHFNHRKTPPQIFKNTLANTLSQVLPNDVTLRHFDLKVKQTKQTGTKISIQLTELSQRLKEVISKYKQLSTLVNNWEREQMKGNKQSHAYPRR